MTGAGVRYHIKASTRVQIQNRGHRTISIFHRSALPLISAKDARNTFCYLSLRSQFFIATVRLKGESRIVPQEPI